MIYLIMCVVLGYAAWQIIKVVKNSKKGSCASGCSSCGHNQNCTIQVVELMQKQNQNIKIRT